MKKRKSYYGKKNKNLIVIVFGILIVSLFAFGPRFIKNNPPCANSISCIKDLSGKYEENEKGVFLGRIVNSPKFDNTISKPTKVLGASDGPKHIYVDLSTQRLTAYEGDTKVFDFPVATGKWNHTPTGDFKIWVKLKYTRMSGGSGADYYNLPNVPYTMFFYNDQVGKGEGYSIHGAYWHNNFGYPMSHGCVNMRPEDAEKLFYWADPQGDAHTTHATNDNPGTTVTVTGENPQ